MKYTLKNRRKNTRRIGGEHTDKTNIPMNQRTKGISKLLHAFKNSKGIKPDGSSGTSVPIIPTDKMSSGIPRMLHAFTKKSGNTNHSKPHSIFKNLLKRGSKPSNMQNKKAETQNSSPEMSKPIKNTNKNTNKNNPDLPSMRRRWHQSRVSN